MVKIEKGQTVYLKAVGNNARDREDIYYAEAEITKVGRKYIAVKHNWSEYQFEINNSYREKTIYSPSWELYFSVQDIYDEEERVKLFRELNLEFNYIGGSAKDCSLDQLKRIKSILDESEVNE